MFIVAVTLGLLAAMGVYGLTATAVDVRAAGHMRQAAQAQAAAEHAMMITASTFTPASTEGLMRKMLGGTQGGVGIQSLNCRTANPYNASTNGLEKAAQACLAMATKDLFVNVGGTAAWPTYDTTRESTFASDSFGQTVQQPFIRVEVTNPVNIPPPPGNSYGSGMTFTQVTLTTFVQMKGTTSPTAAATMPPETVAQGRGRLTLPPWSGGQ